MVVGAYIGVVIAAIALGAYLLSLPVTVWTVALMALTSIFIGTRLRGINNIVHECCHSTFSQNREDNVQIGRVCTSILMKNFRKYRDDHLSHHANNGDYENDAEFKVIEKFGLHDPLTARTIFRHFVTPLLGRHLPYYVSINMSGDDGRFYVWLKLVLLAGIATLFVVSPLVAIFFVIVPLFYVYPTLNFWTDCLDHAGLLGAEDELKASRNVLAPSVIRLLFFPRNDSYHLVHHLFPQIPARHLHRAHAELSKDPTYQSVPSAVQPVGPRLEKSRFEQVL
ncbi:MAG: fatty acid desaturase [Pseudomonadota bacterium]